MTICLKTLIYPKVVVSLSLGKLRFCFLSQTVSAYCRLRVGSPGSHRRLKVTTVGDKGRSERVVTIGNKHLFLIFFKGKIQS